MALALLVEMIQLQTKKQQEQQEQQQEPHVFCVLKGVAESVVLQKSRSQSVFEVSAQEEPQFGSTLRKARARRDRICQDLTGDSLTFSHKKHVFLKKNERGWFPWIFSICWTCQPDHVACICEKPPL